MLKLPESVIVQLLTDPVLAAKVLLNWDLDDFQAAALRIDWWFPETIDDSAVGTGKTLRIFILSNLRAVLIPNQRIAVYFPVFQVAKDEFWPYFQETIKKSDFFAQQLLPHHGKLGEKKDPGAWSMRYINGSEIIVPAPGHSTDGDNQAGRSINTLIVDDWRRCEEKGDAIAKQLIDRVRRPSFNQHHAIWGNHIHFKGHAESPSHKSNSRVTKFKRAIRDGSTRHAIYSFCYRDISKRWAKLIRNDGLIRTQRTNLADDRRFCQLLGISARQGSSFYPETALWRCCRPGINPQVRREREGDIYVLGVDVAPGASRKADYCSFYIDRLRRGGDGAEITLLDEQFGEWEIASVFAYTLRGVSAGEVSGFIYWLYARFGFAAIVMDPGAAGGGTWVYLEMRKIQQTWNGITVTVIPISDANEPMEGDKLPILHWFKRSSKTGELSFIHPNAKVSENGFIHAWHLRYQTAWHSRHIAHPMAMDDRPPNALLEWEPDQIVAQQTLEKGIEQLTKVFVLTDSEGRVLMGAGGFPMFRAVGKKDIAYSGLYAFAAAMVYVENVIGVEDMDPADTFSAW